MTRINRGGGVKGQSAAFAESGEILTEIKNKKVVVISNNIIILTYSGVHNYWGM